MGISRRVKCGVKITWCYHQPAAISALVKVSDYTIWCICSPDTQRSYSVIHCMSGEDQAKLLYSKSCRWLEREATFSWGRLCSGQSSLVLPLAPLASLLCIFFFPRRSWKQSLMERLLVHVVHSSEWQRAQLLSQFDIRYCYPRVISLDIDTCGQA